jgi:hypothetical protein
MDVPQARTEAIQEDIIAKMDAHQKRMRASMNVWRKEMTACQEAMDACLESKGPTSLEEKESVAVHEEVPKEEATVKTVRQCFSIAGPSFYKKRIYRTAVSQRVRTTAVRSLKEQYGDQHLALGRHQ